MRFRNNMNNLNIIKTSVLNEKTNVEFSLNDQFFYFTDHFVNSAVLPAYSLLIIVRYILQRYVFNNDSTIIDSVSRLNFKGSIFPNMKYVLVFSRKSKNTFSFEIFQEQKKILNCSLISVHQEV